MVAKILEVSTIHVPTILFGTFFAWSPATCDQLFLVSGAMALVTCRVRGQPWIIFRDSMCIGSNDAATSGHRQRSCYKWSRGCVCCACGSWKHLNILSGSSSGGYWLLHKFFSDFLRLLNRRRIVSTLGVLAPACRQSLSLQGIWLWLHLLSYSCCGHGHIGGSRGNSSGGRECGIRIALRALIDVHTCYGLLLHFLTKVFVQDLLKAVLIF